MTKSIRKLLFGAGLFMVAGGAGPCTGVVPISSGGGMNNLTDGAIGGGANNAGRGASKRMAAAAILSAITTWPA